MLPASTCTPAYRWAAPIRTAAPTDFVTTGIYRWTRNPQYATAIPAFLGLAVAADSWRTAVLTAALVATYALMALAEEPWLRRSYGADYERYAQRVPRFFNWRRAWALGELLFKRARAQSFAVGRDLWPTEAIRGSRARRP